MCAMAVRRGRQGGRRRRRRAGSAAAVVGTCTGALLATLLIPAAAGPLPGRGSTASDHVMGAAIRAHEGSHAPGARAVREPPSMAATRTPGLDVSHYQGHVDWDAVVGKGARFVYIKATEGTGFRDPKFNANYVGAYEAGLIRGAYHYGRPDVSGGAAQAEYFVAHGGGWSADGQTLPGALDIEYGAPRQGGTCYGLSKQRMADWIASFAMKYHASTGRWPVIYTSTNWWSQCVGSEGKSAETSPLWIARYADSIGTLPGGWDHHCLWQYADFGRFPGDQDWFNGGSRSLQALAQGSPQARAAG